MNYSINTFLTYFCQKVLGGRGGASSDRSPPTEDDSAPDAPGDRADAVGRGVDRLVSRRMDRGKAKREGKGKEGKDVQGISIGGRSRSKVEDGSAPVVPDKRDDAVGCAVDRLVGRKDE